MKKLPIKRPLAKRILLILTVILTFVTVFDLGFYAGWKTKPAGNPDLVYLIPKQNLVVKPICNPNQLVSVEEIVAEDGLPAIRMHCIDQKDVPRVPQQKGWGIPK